MIKYYFLWVLTDKILFALDSITLFDGNYLLKSQN